MPITFTFTDPDGGEHEGTLPSCWAVCPSCRSERAFGC